MAEQLDEPGHDSGQRSDDEEVDGKPDGATPVGVPSEHAGRRFRRLVLDPIFLPGDLERVRVVEMSTRDRPDAMWAEEAFLVEHPCQDSAKLVLVHQ